MDPKEKKIIKQTHHERKQLCTTRPAYRQGRKLTAVKVPDIADLYVYTVSDESQHLIIRGVPSINLQKELKNLCMRYGEVKLLHQAKDYAEDEEPFTEVFHVLFAKIQAARFAKHMIDDKSFFGGVLHVCYAPELETISETRHKLDQRRHEVLQRLSQYTAADVKKSQQMCQSAGEPVPGPSGTQFNPPTRYPSQHRFSSPNNTNQRFKKPSNQYSNRKHPLPRNNLNQTKSRFQSPQNHVPPVLIGPKQPEPTTAVQRRYEFDIPSKSQPVATTSASSTFNNSHETDNQNSLKRTLPINLSKFVPTQVKKIRFNIK